MQRGNTSTAVNGIRWLLSGMMALLIACDVSSIFTHAFVFQPSVWTGNRGLLTSSTLSYSPKEADDDYWYPRSVVYDDVLMGLDEAFDLECRAVELMAKLIRKRLAEIQDGKGSRFSERNITVSEYAKGRFMDLTYTAEGERELESLFDEADLVGVNEHVVRGAVIALQSLIIYGTQVGVKGTPAVLQRMVAHLETKEESPERDMKIWDVESVRRIKYRKDRTAGVQLLAELSWKRSTQGAFELLVTLGAWQRHEDLALLRSGFSIRFTDAEEKAAVEASLGTHDPDALLGLRRDLRDLKVYTIDSASTSEIDDGLSAESIQGKDGSERKRIWIHIADSNRWAPRDSTLFDIARRRVISLYLPQGSIPMFPSSVSTKLMSLTANKDVCAISLGVELLEDGSVDPESIVVTPSLIRVNYRLTYDDVDEMLQEGIAYKEEWQLGALLEAAKARRDFRIRNGSLEGVIPTQIPQTSVSLYPDKTAPDSIGISINVQASHNAGHNQTVGADDRSQSNSFSPTVSSASLLVTESMILAGEALGRWKLFQDESRDAASEEDAIQNSLKLAFRAQPKPDYNSRSRERKVMMDLLELNVGGGYCHAWYSRRFLQPAKVTELPMAHAGLGLPCYVQWTSPIRRFADLQVHTAVKRFLRRQRVNELLRNGSNIPSELTEDDLGCLVPRDGIPIPQTLDIDIDFLEGQGLVGAARNLQRQSQQYWIFEYIRRRTVMDPDLTFEALVLGCIDPEKRLYAIYVYELGLEHRYVVPAGELKQGAQLRLMVASVYPRTGLLTFAQIYA